MSVLAPDAAVCLAGRDGAQRIHLFKGRQVAVWDVAVDGLVDGYPSDIDDHYPGLLARGPERNLRAAFHVPEWGPQIFFLFEGQSEYVVWSVDEARALPESIASNRLLPCPFPAGDFTPVVAMTPSGQRVIYGFHDFDYVQWTVRDGALQSPDAGFPRKTADDWKDGLVLAPRAGVYVEWTTRSSAHSNKKIYFFMGNLYLRWDVPSNTRNYRLDVVTGWKGWPTFAESSNTVRPTT